MKPLFLISNDDGIHAKGLDHLIRLARCRGDVLVVVPDGERSGMSAAFTVQTPLSVTKVSEEPGLTVYVSNGTPVDCVKIALNRLCRDRQPDMVLSGINHGYNGSVAIHYSGTLGAAMEGAMAGIPAIAFSLDSHSPNADFSPSIPFLETILDTAIMKGIPPFVCLNVNIPTGNILGIRVCRQGRGRWEEELLPCPHPYRSNLYWLTGHFVNLEPDAPDQDIRLKEKGYITVVPQQIDMTCYPLLQEMKEWFR